MNVEVISNNPPIIIKPINIDVPYWMTTLKYRFFENVSNKNYNTLSKCLREIDLNKIDFTAIKNDFVAYLLNSIEQFKNTVFYSDSNKFLEQQIETNNLAIVLDTTINICRQANRLTDRVAKYTECAKELEKLIKKYR